MNSRVNREESAPRDMASTPPGYHLVGYHLVYAILEGVGVSRRRVGSPEDVSTLPVDAHHGSCSTYEALAGFLPAPVEVIFEGGGGGERAGGDLAVYVVTNVAGESVTHRVSVDACSGMRLSLAPYTSDNHRVMFFFFFFSPSHFKGTQKNPTQKKHEARFRTHTCTRAHIHTHPHPHNTRVANSRAQAKAKRTIGGSQSALSAVASLCVTDRIPLLGTVEAVQRLTKKKTQTREEEEEEEGEEEKESKDGDGDESEVDDEIVVTLR